MLSDRESLLEIYRSTEGRYWYRKWNWEEDDVLPISKWFGIQVDLSGHILRLNLKGNNLVGSIETLSLLKHLVNCEVFSLGTNTLIGFIPRSIGDMHNLLELDLSWNQLKGEIPSTLWKLSKLRVLKLDHNHLIGELTVELFQLNDLRYLDLSYNQFSGVLPVLDQHLPHLQMINLFENKFEGQIPMLVKEYRMMNSNTSMETTMNTSQTNS